MLIFNNVDISYDNHPVFQDLNFQIDQGEFVFLIGKSGVGNTTLLNLIYMDCFQQSGKVQVVDYSSEKMFEKLENLYEKLSS